MYLEIAKWSYKKKQIFFLKRVRDGGSNKYRKFSKKGKYRKLISCLHEINSVNKDNT